MLEFIIGEVQYVSATVRPEMPNEIAVINSASYKLTDYENKTVIQSGDCEIEENVIRALLDLSDEGIYKLTIEAQIGKETVIKDKVVSVSE